MFARPRGCDEQSSPRGSQLVVRDVGPVGDLDQGLHIALACRTHAIADDRLHALRRHELDRDRIRHEDNAIDRLDRKRGERAEQSLIAGIERRDPAAVDELEHAIAIIDPDARQRVVLLEREGDCRRVVQVLLRRAVDEHGHTLMRGDVGHQHGDRRDRSRPGREDAQPLVRYQRVGLAQVEAIVAEVAGMSPRPRRVAFGATDARIVELQIGAVGQRHDDGRLPRSFAETREIIAARDLAGRIRNVAARPRRV
ncbi:MAG: hypothetical protein JWN90_269 [Parcubacteria group bacterium]|nr:hypothetical protein [Parcubacteria group bacterium]